MTFGDKAMKSKTNFRIVTTLVLGTALAVILVPSASMQSAINAYNPKIADLAWMSGDWQTAAGGRAQIDEHWTLPAGGTMLGVGRTIAGDKTVEFEYLRIEQRANGIFYVASPQGRPATDFKMTRLSGQEVVFENPEHDFPKRIIYKKNADGSLVATIDAGEKTKSQTFTYLPVRN
jgi:hypothetical protein